MIFPQENQFIHLLLCFSFGYIFGLLSCGFELFSVAFKGKFKGQILLGLRLLLLAVFFILLKNAYDMGEIRLFMPAFSLIGFCVYLKTMGKIIAKLAQRLYNNIVKIIIYRRKRLNDLRKTSKNSSGNNRFRRFIALYFNKRNGLSNDRYKRKKGRNRQVESRNRGA